MDDLALFDQMRRLVYSGPVHEPLQAPLNRIRAWLQTQPRGPLPAHSRTANQLKPIDALTFRLAVSREIESLPRETLPCTLARLVRFCDELVVGDTLSTLVTLRDEPDNYYL